MKIKIQRPAQTKIKYQPNQWLLVYSAMGLMFFMVGLIFLLEFLKKGIIRYQFLLPAEVTDPQRAYVTSGGLMLAGLGFTAWNLIDIIKDYKKWKKKQTIISSKDYDPSHDTDIPDTAICLNCKEPFAGKKLSSMKCPKCGGRLEDLIGFYERHPELKDNDNKG